MTVDRARAAVVQLRPGGSVIGLTLALACHAPPPGAPEGAFVLDVRDGRLGLRPPGWFTTRTDLGIGLVGDLSDAPTEPVHEGLVSGLAPAIGRPVVAVLPAETPFWAVRRTVGSAQEARVGGMYLALPERDALQVMPPPRLGIGDTCSAPREVRGVTPIVTVSLQADADETWALAMARFVPRFDEGPVDGLDPACLLVPPCDALYPADDPRRAACAEAPPDAPDRVGLGGEHGCLLPIAREPVDVQRWPPELAKVLRALALGADPVVVMPEARSRLDAVAALLRGFVEAGLPPASIGLTALVEGNDGPPACTATVRDRASLDLAAARWLGGVAAAKLLPPSSPETPP